MATAMTESIREPKAPSLFRNARFVTVWSGHTVSMLGNGFHTVALSLWVLQHTGSATAMSIVFAARILAAVVFGPIAGTFADRTDRRKLMIWTDVIRVVLVAGTIGLMTIGYLPMPLLVTLAFLTSAAGVFFHPAFGASISNIVDRSEVPRASSLLQMTNSISDIAGPALGGLLIALAGAQSALATDAASFAISGLALCLVRFSSPRRDGEKTSFFGDMAEGFRHLRRQPVVFGVIMLGPAFSLSGAAEYVAMPLVALNHWKVSPFEFGLLEVTWPIGMAAAGALLAAYSHKVARRGLLISVAFALSGLLGVIIPLMPNIYPALVLQCIGSVLTGAGLVTIAVVLRTMVPNEFQGRVMGLYGSMANAAWPIGALAGGLLGDRMSPVVLAAACSAGFGLAGVASLFNSRLREFR